MTADLAKKAAQAGYGDIAVKLCSELAEDSTSPSTMQFVYHAGQALAQWQSCTPKVLVDILSKVQTFCSGDLLCDCLELNRALQMASAVHSNCESGDSLHQNDYSGLTWIRDAQFKEVGSLLSSSTVLPLMQNFVLASVAVSSQHLYPYVQQRTSGYGIVDRPTASNFAMIPDSITEEQEGYLGAELAHASMLVMEHLNDNSLQELAFRQTTVTVGCLLQMLSLEGLGISIAEQEHSEMFKAEEQKVGKLLKDFQASMSSLSILLLEKICSQSKVQIAS